MAVVAIYRSKDVDPETFNRYRAEAPIEPAPKGAIFHMVTFDEDGLLVVDVWENEADMRPFSEERILPALRKLAVPQPDLKILPVHALWASGDAAAHEIPCPEPAT